MQLLKQSTAYTFRIGPFVDAVDGVTPETALTIAQADIQISKAGGAFAQTSDAAPVTTHDTDGWYQCPVTISDVDTLGALTVQIAVAGAAPVWKDFMVVPANVFDSLVSGSDYLQMDALQIEGVAATTQINTQAAAALAAYDPPTNTELMIALAALNNLSSADAQAASAAALAAYDPPTNAEMTAALATLTATLNTTRYQKNTGGQKLYFVLVDSSDHVTRQTGINPTAQCCIDGAAFANCTGTITEVGNGVYYLTPSAADINGNDIAYKFTGASCDPVEIALVTYS